MRWKVLIFSLVVLSYAACTPFDDTRKEISFTPAGKEIVDRVKQKYGIEKIETFGWVANINNTLNRIEVSVINPKDPKLIDSKQFAFEVASSVFKAHDMPRDDYSIVVHIINVEMLVTTRVNYEYLCNRGQITYQPM